MKKITVLIVTIVMAVVFSACASTPKEDVKETTTHTIPPVQETTADAEPEWAEVDCDINLADANGNIILSSDDFETFAVVGSTDDDSYIVIKTTQEATDIVKSSDATPPLSVCLNGNTVSGGDVDPATFDGEIKIGEDMPYESLCELANSIRGLF